MENWMTKKEPDWDSLKKSMQDTVKGEFPDSAAGPLWRRQFDAAKILLNLPPEGTRISAQQGQEIINKLKQAGLDRTWEAFGTLNPPLNPPIVPHIDGGWVIDHNGIPWPNLQKEEIMKSETDLIEARLVTKDGIDITDK